MTDTQIIRRITMPHIFCYTLTKLWRMEMLTIRVFAISRNTNSPKKGLEYKVEWSFFSYQVLLRIQHLQYIPLQFVLDSIKYWLNRSLSCHSLHHNNMHYTTFFFNEQTAMPSRRGMNNRLKNVNRRHQPEHQTKSSVHMLIVWHS